MPTSDCWSTFDLSVGVYDSMIELSAVGAPSRLLTQSTTPASTAITIGTMSTRRCLVEYMSRTSVPCHVRDPHVAGRYPRTVADLRLTTSVDDRPGAGVVSSFGDRLLSGRYQVRARI